MAVWPLEYFWRWASTVDTVRSQKAHSGVGLKSAFLRYSSIGDPLLPFRTFKPAGPLSPWAFESSENRSLGHPYPTVKPQVSSGPKWKFREKTRKLHGTVVHVNSQDVCAFCVFIWQTEPKLTPNPQSLSSNGMSGSLCHVPQWM